MNTTKGVSTYFCLLVLIGFFGFTTLAYAEKLPENILNNGDFDFNLEAWHHWTHADAAALFQPEGKKAEPVIGKKVAYVKISKAGNAVWHVQFYQQPFTLEKGTTYTYSLWAKSEKPRTVVMRILHQGDPWNEYARQTINLSETWKEFFITFKMTGDDVSSRAGVIMGAEKVDVWLDHIRLYEGEFVADIDGAEPQAVDPSDKLTMTWAALRALSF
ncbi:MAG: carbohydrate binding domain-containing protein [Candidatus Poribacteria bacterium]|nr:carbohydrate binding domain-containing protein [Candidatus Poribacteria bacterium]